MKMTSCFTLWFLLFSGLVSARESITIGLSQGDSIWFFDHFNSPPQSTWKTVLTPRGPIQVLTLVKFFNSHDNLVQISCTAENMQGTMMGHHCIITINETPDSSGPNLVIHYSDQVIGVKIGSTLDSQNMYDQFLKPLPSYSTLETVKVTAPNGQIIDYPKLRISCGIDYPHTPPRSCEIRLVK